MTSYFYDWLKMWTWYKKGKYPYEKDFLELPWKIVRVFEVFDNIYDEKKK